MSDPSDGPVVLPISRRLNGEGAQNLYQNDLKRANALIGRGSEQAFFELENTPAENRDVSYIASVGVGSPPTQCESWADAN